MKLRRSGLVLASGATLFFFGCTAGTTLSNPFSGSRAETEVKVYVTNLAFSDATIYGITNSGRRRLGRVTGKDEVVFTMPLRISSEMYLEIDFLAGPRCETERLIVDPGDHLDLVIQSENTGWRCYNR